MSDLDQINTALERLFNEEGQRIVFWNDPDQEFQSTLPFVMLDGVTTLRLDQVGALEAKIRLEREEPTASSCCTRRPRNPTTRTTGCSTSASTAAASGPTGPASCCKSWGWSTSTCGPTLPTAASSSTPRSGSRRSRRWSPRTMSPPTWTAR